MNIKKKLTLLLAFFCLLVGLWPLLTPTHAQAQNATCESMGIFITADPNPVPSADVGSITFTISGNLTPNQDYRLNLQSFYNYDPNTEKFSISNSGDTATIVWDIPLYVDVFNADSVITLRRAETGYNDQICDASTKLQIVQSVDSNTGGSCTISVSPQCPDKDTGFVIDIGGLDPSKSDYIVEIREPGLGNDTRSDRFDPRGDGSASVSFGATNNTGEHQIQVFDAGASTATQTGVICFLNLIVPESNPGGQCTDELSPGKGSFDLCTSVSGDPTAYDACLACNDGIWTAIGCIETDPKAFVPQILTFAISLAGGVSLLLMLFGAFTITIAAGNPENVQKGKEIITSAITGLLLIIFSVVILQIIGVDLLNIPGF